MADRFEELRIFVAVADAGGVNAAAARLKLAKSAVSRRIAALEERLGIDLLSRETRRFALTPAGVAHHARAKVLLADLDELDRSATEGDRIRTLTVSAPLELAVHVMAPALAALAGGRPEAAFSLSVDDPRADVTIAIRRASGKGKVNGEIGRSEMVRYANSEPAGAAAAASVGPAIEVSVQPDWVPIPDTDPAHLGSVVVGTLDMALAAAIGGAGVATLPDFMAADAVANGRLIAMVDQRPGPSTTITATVAPGVDARELLALVAARLRRP